MMLLRQCYETFIRVVSREHGDLFLVNRLRRHHRFILLLQIHPLKELVVVFLVRDGAIFAALASNALA